MISSILSIRSFRYLLYTTLLILLIGIVGFRLIEHWRWIDCVNYCVSTMVTTGDAGIIPKSDTGKVFNVFYMFTSVVLILLFVNSIAQHMHEIKQSTKAKRRRHESIVKNHLNELMKNDKN